MDSVPTITSAGALWASTPLLAAAQLWSWHPLWAAGIWTAYGIGSLVPQGEAWLKPLTESPVHAQFNFQYPPRGMLDILVQPDHFRRTYGVSAITIPSKSSSFATVAPISVSTPTSIASHLKSAEKSCEDEVSASVLSMEVTRSDVISIIVLPTNSYAANSSSRAHIVAMQHDNDANNSSRLSTTIASLPPTESTVTLSSPSTPASGALATSNVRTQTSHYHNKNFEVPPKPISWENRFGFVLDFSSKSQSIFGLVLLMTVVSACVLVFVVRNSVLECLRGPTVGIQLRSWVPFKTFRGLLQRLQLYFQIVYHILFETQVGNDEAHPDEVNAARQWLANFVWGGETPRARVVRAVSFYSFTVALMFYPFWLVCCLDVSFTSVVYKAIAPLVNGISMPTSAVGFSSGLPDATITAPWPQLTINLTSTSFNHLRHCTVAAYNNGLYSNGSYKPLPMFSTHTSTICSWIESSIMHLRFMPLLLRTSSATALRQCYTTAWTTHLSTDGWYYMARQSGPTAAWCTTIEWLVMNYRVLALAIAPYLAIAEAALGRVRSVVGCMPIMSMFSGSLCPVWMHMANRALCVALLTLLCALNILIVMSRPTPQPRSVSVLAKLAMEIVCLMVTPLVSSAWFLSVVQSSLEAEWATIGLTLVVFWYFRKSWVMKWNVVLQSLRFVPAEDLQGQQ